MIVINYNEKHNIKRLKLLNNMGVDFMSNMFRSFDEDNIKDVVNSDELKKVANNQSVKDFINNDQFGQFKEKYRDKSDDEILNDAKLYADKLKNQYGEEEYNKKLEDLKRFEKFLNPQQRNKMKKFLENLK